ncbi:Riboflavin biosynthesis protein RibD [Botrimarina hoheduenensis]|uniref:Riboflavin biosynthesis protein RibD n=2 Tax=Botrimarina hoheduenensis TaxID=2528000 RepID=A0A5C5W859_9BACT|nr:Riboflavin biosynthesis protein RibD [Botrimarina hoheduenensis]
MGRAIQLARRGEGSVEPNPLVGCVVVRDDQVVGEGWHERFGGPHAEVNALQAAGALAQGATLYVTLEPCCHTGKTPPCVSAVIASGVQQVVIAHHDPFPQVDGAGVAALQAAGVECVEGVLKAEAAQLLAPYLKLVTTGRPWVIGKWAMTLDGKIATRTGSSKWISGEASRAFAHEIRGRMDAIVVGAGTLVADDPLLTARPPGPRKPVRVVIAGDRPLPLDRKLWKTPDGGPVLVAIGAGYPIDEAAALESCGVEVIQAEADALLDELGRRRLTNVLVEGGGKLLGQLFDERLVDEALVFIAPKIIGGHAAPGPLGGIGAESIEHALKLVSPSWICLGDDLCLRGRLPSA